MVDWMGGGAATGSSVLSSHLCPLACLPPSPPAPYLQLPPGWSEGRDPASGATYFYNAASGEGRRLQE